MANSKVGICNMALTLLAAERILSITDKNEAARKCDVLYPMCLDSLLSEHNWNFACCECRLARLDEESEMLQFGAVYQLPDDCIRVQRCIKDYKFKVKGRKLYTNVEPCYIEYITNHRKTQYRIYLLTFFISFIRFTKLLLSYEYCI